LAAGFIACTSPKSNEHAGPVGTGGSAAGGAGGRDSDAGSGGSPEAGAAGGIAGNGASGGVGGSGASGGVDGGDASGGSAGSGAAGSAGTSDAEAGVSNTPPTAGALTLTVVEGTRRNAVTLPSSDPDPGARLTHRLVREPVHGLASLTDLEHGTLNFESRAGETGLDSFSYQVNDGVNDAPSAGEVSVRVLPLGPTRLAIDPPEDGGPPQNGLLGPDLDIDGDTAIIGSIANDVHGGAAYIARRERNGSWKIVQKLTAGDRASNVFRFGEYVAIDGDYALVGAWGDWVAPPPSGAAFVFKRGANGEFEFLQFFEAPEPASGDQFGGHTRISGRRAIMNGRGANTALQTQVHVYRLEAGTQWSWTKTIRSPAGEVWDFFGVDTDLEGDTIVVGAAHDDQGGAFAGAAYIFRPTAAQAGDAADVSDAGSDAAPDAPPGEDWSLYKKWLPPEPEGKACLNLAMSGDTVLCSAPLAYGEHGVVYAFSIDGDDSVQELKPPEDEQSTIKLFGWAVAIDGDTAAVAPDGTANDDHGTAYIFRRIGGKWVHYGKLGTGTSTLQQFPMGLAIDGPTLIATSPIEALSSYVFNVPLAGTD